MGQDCPYCLKGVYAGHSHEQGMGQLNLATLITRPDEAIATIKKEGTKIALIFAGALVVLNWLMLHQALNQKIKRIRRG